MSSLLTGLSVLGGVALIGVIVYNEWQQRSATMRVAPGEQEKRDPTDGQALADVADDGSAALSVAAPQSVPAIDPLIDSVVTLELPHLYYGELLLTSMPPTRRVGSKPFFIEALSADTGEWEYPQAGKQYSQVQAAVQLANRLGALNDIEFSEFVMKTQSYADAIGADGDFPDMPEEVARARELDEFSSKADSELTFRIAAISAAWSAGYVQQHAQRLGFVAGMRPGRMVYPSRGDAAPLVVLNFDAHAALAEDLSSSALREIFLVLDVPHVSREENAYGIMRDLAIKLAASMDGRITDGQNGAITLATMDAVEQELETLYDKLDAHDLSAGSPQARRLFA